MSDSPGSVTSPPLANSWKPQHCLMPSTRELSQEWEEEAAAGWDLPVGPESLAFSSGQKLQLAASVISAADIQLQFTFCL